MKLQNIYIISKKIINYFICHLWAGAIYRIERLLKEYLALDFVPSSIYTALQKVRSNKKKYNWQSSVCTRNFGTRDQHSQQ